MRMIKHHTLTKVSVCGLMTCVLCACICVYCKTSGARLGMMKNSPDVSGGDRECGQRGGDWGGARISPPSKYNGLRKGTCYE